MEREDGQRGRQGFPLKLVMVKKDGKMVGCKGPPRALYTLPPVRKRGTSLLPEGGGLLGPPHS